MTTRADATTTTTYQTYALPPRPATPIILSAMARPFQPSSPMGIAPTSATMNQPTAQDWYILRSLHQQVYAYRHALFRPHDGPPAIAPVPMHVAIPPPPNTSSSSSFPFALPSGSPPPLPSGPLPTNLDSPPFAPGLSPGMEMGMQAPPEQQQPQISQLQPTRTRRISKSKKRLEKQLKQGLLRRKQLQQENLLLNYDSDSTPTANKLLPVSSTTIVPPAISETATRASGSTPAPALGLPSTHSTSLVPLAEEALPVGDSPLSTASDDQVRSEEVLRAMLKGGLARSKVPSTKLPATTSNSATSSLPPNLSTTQAGNENADIANGTKDKGKGKASPQEIEVITLDDDDDEIEEGEIPVDPVERRKSLTTQSSTAKKTTAVPIPIPFPPPRPKKRRKSFEVEIEDMGESPPRGDFEYDQVPRGPRGYDPATSPSSHVIMAPPPPLAPSWPSRMYDRWANQEPGEVVRPSYESSQSLSKSLPWYPPQLPAPPSPPPQQHHRIERPPQFQPSSQQQLPPQRPSPSHPPPPPHDDLAHSEIKRESYPRYRTPSGKRKRMRSPPTVPPTAFAYDPRLSKTGLVPPEHTPPPSMPPPPPPQFSYPPPPLPSFSHPPPYLQQYQHQYDQQPQSQQFPHPHALLHLYPPPFPSPSPSPAPYQYPYQPSSAPAGPHPSHPYHGYEPPPPQGSSHLHSQQFHPGQAGFPPPSSYTLDPRPPLGFYGTNSRPPF